MADKASESKTVDTIKLWIFPTLVTILGTMIWTELRDMKKTLETVVVQVGVNSARIQTLDKDVDALKNRVFYAPGHRTADVQNAPVNREGTLPNPQPVAQTKTYYYDPRKKYYVSPETEDDDHEKAA